MNKRCPRCQIHKDIIEFTKTSSHCRDCRREYNVKWRAENVAYLAEYEKATESQRKARGEKYREENSDKIREHRVKYQAENREILARKRRRNPYVMNETQKRRSKETQKAWRQKQQKENVYYRLVRYLRKELNDKIRNRLISNKQDRFILLLSCRFTYYDNYMRRLFLEGMSWDNWGEWEIDHIKPVSTFDLNDEAQQLACFHYTNTRPIWADVHRKTPRIVF